MRTCAYCFPMNPRWFRASRNNVVLPPTRRAQGSDPFIQRRVTHKEFLDAGSQPAGNTKGGKFTRQVMRFTPPLQGLQGRNHLAAAGQGGTTGIGPEFTPA